MAFGFLLNLFFCFSLNTDKYGNPFFRDFQLVRNVSVIITTFTFIVHFFFLILFSHDYSFWVILYKISCSFSFIPNLEKNCAILWMSRFSKSSEFGVFTNVA